MKEAIAIFDIGKTNKKFFLFDRSFNILEKEQIKIPEIVDENGYPSEDLEKLIAWVRDTFMKYQVHWQYKVTHLNFSTYGASLVYLDEMQNVVAPFYNYLKPVDETFSKHFDEQYDTAKTALETCSPDLDLLNSGFQLYWFKRKFPGKFEKVRHVLHFPQYSRPSAPK